MDEEEHKRGFDILPELSAIVRGLSVMFWGLPLALIIVVWTATRATNRVPTPLGDLLHSLGIVPALLTSAMLFYGVRQLGRYQPLLDSWQRSVERAKWLGLFFMGLSPFLYWWSRVPENFYFKISAVVLLLISLCFLAQINVLLRRLTCMLPDQTLRAETSFMARFNFTTLTLLGLVQLFFFAINSLSPELTAQWLTYRQLWLLRPLEILALLFMVMPIAITMAVMWKTKEVIFESVFSADR